MVDLEFGGEAGNRAGPRRQSWPLLILLGASLLALRAFRESYLKIWVVGWAALRGIALGGTLPGGEDSRAF